MAPVRLSKRWAAIILALVLITAFYVIGYHGVDVSIPGGHSIHYDGFPVDREDLGFAWYDYLNNPPTTSVRANIPEAVTKLCIATTSSAAVKATSSSVEPFIIAPPAKPFQAPQISPGIATLDNDEYSRMLVITRKKKEDVRWLEAAKKSDPLLGSIVYNLDDAKGDRIVSKGKPMVYLQYIIDNYDDLRDITIFLPAMQASWRLDPLLNNSAHNVLKHMSRVKVIEDGFFNLRCKTDPGCPKGIYLNMNDEFFDRPEDQKMNEVWREFFGDQTPPKILSQPHYSQYALSRDRIRAIPKEQYQYFSDRLAASTLDLDAVENFWQSTWHFIWYGNETYCPKEIDCFCEGYGICFKDHNEYDLRLRQEAELSKLEKKVVSIKITGDKVKDKERNELLAKIHDLKEKMTPAVVEAMARGAQKRKQQLSTLATTTVS